MALEHRSLLAMTCGSCVVPVLSQHLYFYFMLNQSLYFSLFYYCCFLFFSFTLVVRKESSVCKSKYKYESNKIVNADFSNEKLIIFFIENFLLNLKCEAQFHQF